MLAIAQYTSSMIVVCCCLFLQALVEACKADRSGAVKRSFAAANAAVARFAAPARVEKQVASLLEMYGADDADSNTRLVAGMPG